MPNASNEPKASDLEVMGAGGIADLEGDVDYLRSYVDRASWRHKVPDDVLDEFLELIYGEKEGA